LADCKSPDEARDLLRAGGHDFARLEIQETWVRFARTRGIEPTHEVVTVGGQKTTSGRMGRIMHSLAAGSTDYLEIQAGIWTESADHARIGVWRVAENKIFWLDDEGELWEPAHSYPSRTSLQIGPKLDRGQRCVLLPKGRKFETVLSSHKLASGQCARIVDGFQVERRPTDDKWYATSVADAL
jgi:hypothetical protein